MTVDETKKKKLRTIKWFLKRRWESKGLDRHYFAQHFAPNYTYASLEAKDVTLLDGVHECEDFLKVFQELAERYYNEEFCWCGPQVLVAVVHAAFARILLEGTGDWAYGKMSAVKWHCFPVARLNEGLTYHDWLRTLDANSHDGSERDKPNDLYDSQREAAFYILRRIGLNPSSFDHLFRGLTSDAYAKNLQLAEAGQVDAVDRLISYHFRAQFFPGSNEKKKNELLVRDLLCKQAKAASLQHCMFAAATFYAGRIESSLTPQSWSGDADDISDFTSRFSPDLTRTLSCLELALGKHDAGDVTVRGWEIKKEDILLEVESLTLAVGIAKGASLPPYSQPEKVVMRAKAYACSLVLPLFTASKTGKVDDLAIEWGQKLGIPFFLMMSSVYAWRGEATKQYAWSNLGFIDCRDFEYLFGGQFRDFPRSLYPKEETFPRSVRLSAHELEEAQVLTFDLLKQLLSNGSADLPVSRYLKFRIGLEKLSDSAPYSVMDDYGILKYSLGCLCGNVRKFPLKVDSSSPQDYAGALAWLSVLANVEAEVLASPGDAVQLIAKGLNHYRSTAHYSCNVFNDWPNAADFLVDENYWARATLSTVPKSTIERAIELLRRIKDDGWKS